MSGLEWGKDREVLPITTGLEGAVTQGLSDAVRRGIQLANQEAQRCNHFIMEPVHLLVGLLQVETRQKWFAAVMLRHLLGDTASLLAEARVACAGLVDTEKHSPYKPWMCWFGPLPKSEGWHAVIAESEREARLAMSEWVGTYHLLLALAGEHGGAATQVLARQGLHGGLLADHLWVVGQVGWPEGAAEVL
jgi:ATP-dependent Clp protease ATP-binding subunit ClpC